MKRRQFLKMTALGAAGVYTGSLIPAADTKASADRGTKPNIILFLCDDLGWGDLGCYGNNRIKTPNLDKFAKEGKLLTNFYVNSPVCSPTRAAIMTGRFPAELKFFYALAGLKENAERQMPNYLDPHQPMLPRLLKEAGYRTSHFGKWHLGGPQDKTAPAPAEYGIDDSATFLSNGPGCYPTGMPEHQSTEVLVDHGIKFIQANKDRPFFMNMWISEPHSFLAPSEEQMAPYEQWAPGKGPHKGAMQIYYAVVSNIDRHFGRLMEALKKQGLYDNTLVIFTSDNGPAPIWGADTSHSGAGSTGPFRGCKASIYEGGIRTPFIARWPKKIPVGVDNKLVMSTADFLPTFCAMAGVELPAEMKLSGEDMTDALTGGSPHRSKPLMWEYRFGPWERHIQNSPALAIRKGKWKLMMNPDRSRVELYDLEANPSEVDSVADTHPQVVEELAAELLAWHKTVPFSDAMPAGAGSFEYPWPK